MKIFVVILVVVSCIDAQLPTLNPIAVEWFERTVHPFLSNCICATGVEEKVVLEWLNAREYPNNACLKCFIKCVLVTSNLFNPDGTLNFLVFRPGVDLNHLTLCYNQTANESDLCQRAYNLNKCARTT
ncbi:hypothetical protein RN001_015314 [Aquatica leii]|uniref:Uncharacterized protein n=1 Tax=Aquatica leii TaxID=1421715 RepID=A0AAN7SNH0_9COLE|nr:hypothetical protein RN001_015314 [Aquatica leii]